MSNLPNFVMLALRGTDTAALQAVVDPVDSDGDIVNVTFPSLPAIEFKYNVNAGVLDFPIDPPRTIRLMADYTANGFWDMAHGWDMSDEDIHSLGLPDNLVGEIKTTLIDIEKEMEKTLDIEMENMHRDGMDYLPEHDQTKTNELQAKLTHLANEANKVSKHKFYAD